MQFLQVVKLPSACWGMLAQLHTSACKSCPAPTGVISAAPAPIEIKLRKVAKRLDLQFDDGKIFTFSAEFLRVKSPSADNAIIGADGRARVTSGRRHVGIMGLEPVGSYALRVLFDDLHKAGIYTWQYLYDLGIHKMSYSRQYIRALREKGLSREPPRRSRAREPTHVIGHCSNADHKH